MSTVGVGERLLRRLRAHRLLPPGVPVELRRLGRSGKSWSWYAIDARTGELLKVASYETMEVCVNAPHWEVERDRHGFTTVRPVSSEQTEAEQHESDSPGQYGASLRGLGPHKLPPGPPDRSRAQLLHPEAMG